MHVQAHALDKLSTKMTWTSGYPGQKQDQCQRFTHVTFTKICYHDFIGTHAFTALILVESERLTETVRAAFISKTLNISVRKVN